MIAIFARSARAAETGRCVGRALAALPAALPLALSLALPAPATAQEGVDADTVLARVGDAEVTVGHLILLKGALPAQLQQLPNEMLLSNLLDQLINQNALSQTLRTPSRATALTIENQVSGLRAAEVIGRVVATAVTDEAVQAAYAETYAAAEPSREFNASHILVETEERARDLLGSLNAGAEFPTLAREHSVGPSGPNGGELGWFGRGAMVPEFEAAVADLEVGEVSQPVQTQFGWHLVRLNDTRMSAAPPLAEVVDDIRAELENRAIEAHLAEVVALTQVEVVEIEVDPAILDRTDLVGN